MRLIPPHETAHGVDAEQHGRVEHAQHELDLLAANGRIVMQHVVEIPDVRQPDAGAPSACSTRRARATSNGLRRSSVFATGSSIASGATSVSVGWSAADNWMVSTPSSRANWIQS